MAETGFRTLSPEAAEVRPILRGLFAEYSQRYGNYFAGDSEQDPVSRYLPPQGLFLVLEEQGRSSPPVPISPITPPLPKSNVSGQPRPCAARALPNAWSDNWNNMRSMPVISISI